MKEHTGKQGFAALCMSLFFIFLRGYFQADKPNANIWLQIYPQSKYKTESMQVLSSLLVKLIFGSWKYRIYCCIQSVKLIKQHLLETVCE